MSSRQIKWLRQQLEAKKPKKQEDITNIDPVNAQNENSTDFSLLMNDENDTNEEKNEENQSINPMPPPPPPPKKNKGKKQKQTEEDEENDLQELILASKKVSEEKEKQKNTFSMQKLNLARELKETMKIAKFDDCLKLPKTSSQTRFMNRLKKWPKNIPHFFNIVPEKNGEDAFRVEYTEYGNEQSSIYHALARINDAQGIMQLGQSTHFSPLVLPLLCQSLLFQREFESATEIALRGLYIIQVSLPTNYLPLQSKLVPSPARKDFLDLIAFVARFAFRRACYETSLNLWKFGISLTVDDPSNFLLVSAVPALYASDSKWIEEMINSDLTWRGIPIRYLPDWTICYALLQPPDEIELLSKEIAKWPFYFEEFGMEVNIDIPPLLSSLATAFKRRTEKFMENSDISSMVEVSVTSAQFLDMSDEQAIGLSYWLSVPSGEVEIADIVEEFAMPTG